MRFLLLLLLLLPAGVPDRAPAAEFGGGNPFIERYLLKAGRKRAAGDLPAARAAVERALERDDQHLGALRLLAEIAGEQGDRDAAVHAWHRWLAVVDAADKAPVPRSERKAVQEALLALDPRAEDFRDLTEDYTKELEKLARDHMKRKRLHTALSIYQELMQVDPLNRGARQAIDDIRRKGGAGLATEDLYAGLDPTFGVDPEWIATENAKHGEWDSAWRKETDNYRYRTDAGFLVLQTSSIAMEQMNRFYRQFFRYKLDGDPTPKIEVRIFKNRDEYLDLGSSPAPWSGGQFTGGAVETYVGGVSGKESLREMYGTLFHEAAHQFVSLTGRGGVPGWLNEAYASFFEGCVILSNGSVRWNQVPPHRLFPLAARMERGWMAAPDEGVRDEAGEWATPERAPTFRIVVEGRYEWGPPWYAPTWGVVFFLYNYRDEEGRAIFRDALHEYYLSGARGRPDPAAWFEQIVLSAPGSPTTSIDELTEIWRTWILDLRDVQIGTKKAGKDSLQYGDAAQERGDQETAREFYEEAYTRFPEDPEVLWKLARVLEEQGDDDRALSLYRDFARELELRGRTEDPRYAEALARAEELDPLFQRQRRLKERLLARGLELARWYRAEGMPSMAMEIARRMSARFSLPAALDFYAEVARETGRSLARWKVAYNEFDLEGWSGSDAYKAYGEMILANVEEDPTITAAAGTFQTQELACDVTFDADFSLEAEMQYESGASLMGLCFGRKDGNNTHAVVLHPKGYLDISTKQGGMWSVRDHRQVKIDRGWQKLRIDVVDDTVDVYLNGRYVRSMQMPSRDSLRGAFGLITGLGRCSYRNIRLLARDPHDPAARIERELAMSQVEGGGVEREPGTFSGGEPPEIQVSTWLQGEPASLAGLRGQVVSLIFWAPYQDEVIPTTAYYAALARDYGPLGVVFVAVVSRQHGDQEVRSWLAEHPMPGVRVGMDAGWQTYRAYNLGAEGWGLPRLLLIDVDGKVVWEGDPGLKAGAGWHPGDPETFFDGPLKELVERRRLRELAAHREDLATARTLWSQGKAREALGTLAALADLDAEWHPAVREARDLRQTIAGRGQEVLEMAVRVAREGRPLRARALLQFVAREYAESGPGDRAGVQLRDLGRSPALREAEKAWRILVRAAGQAGRGKDASWLLPKLDEARAASTLAEIQEATDTLREALLSGGPDAFLEAWRGLQQALEAAPEISPGPGAPGR